MILQIARFRAFHHRSYPLHSPFHAWRPSYNVVSWRLEV